jgi:sporulation protein YlmC with PRC-barrel domain
MTLNGHSSNVVKAKSEVIGIQVKNMADENLGSICEVMLDKTSGRVAYLVLESGSFLGLGGKLIALPWNAVQYDKTKECFLVNIDKEKIKKAPGFDHSAWPDMADRGWGESVSEYYGTKDYWE